jgi:RNA polymerase sigma-70 factor (ECF subfamily)
MSSQPTHRDYRAVFAFVRSRVRSREDAEDITQQVFVEAAASLARSTIDARATTAWLYTVAHRRIVDEMRRRSRSRTVSLELVREPEAPDNPYGPRVTTAFSAALKQLDDRHREILVGRLLRGRSFRDLAADAGINEEAARMRFMRALRAVRTLFEQEGVCP